MSCTSDPWLEERSASRPLRLSPPQPQPQPQQQPQPQPQPQPQQQQQPKQQQPWTATVNLVTSPIVQWSIIIRLILTFRLLVPVELDSYLHSRSLASTLIQPILTPYEVEQSLSLRKLLWSTSSLSSSSSSSSSSSITTPRFGDFYLQVEEMHLPPLLLAVLEPLGQLGPGPNSYLQQALWGILLLLVDYGIAKLLEQLARSVLFLSSNKNLNSSNNNNNNSNDALTLLSWEDRLQGLLPDVIRPKLAHIFPIQDGTTDKYVSLLSLQQIPGLVGLWYFCNPITILSSSVLKCFQNLRLLFLVASFQQAAAFACAAASQKQQQQQQEQLWIAAVAAGASAAVAVYLDAALAVFLIPTTALIMQSSSGRQRAMTVTVVSFVFSMWYLGLLSYALLGSLEKCKAVLWQTTLSSRFALSGSPPSLSIFWYTQMELFRRFSTFFQVMFVGLPFTLVIPVAIRLYRYPMVLVATYWLVLTILRPVSTLYELNIGLLFLLLSPRSLARVNPVVCLVSLCGLWVPAILFVLLHWMWLEAGNGEANFLFFQCLAYNIFVFVLLFQFVRASVNRDKALCLMEKEEMKHKKKY